MRASLIPDVNTVAKEKKKLLNSLNRMLLKTIPGYQRVLKSQRSHLDKYAALFQEEVSTHILNPLTVTLGEPITEVQLTQREFTPPFEFGDVSTSEMQPLIKVDQSFVDSETGIMVHDLRFRHNDDGWFNWGGDPFGWSEAYCRIGVNFRVPEAGFLDFNVVIQNLYNKISFSISDNFGFSDAKLLIFHWLQVEVLGLTHQGKEMCRDGGSSCWACLPRERAKQFNLPNSELHAFHPELPKQGPIP